MSINTLTLKTNNDGHLEYNEKHCINVENSAQNIEPKIDQESFISENNITGFALFENFQDKKTRSQRLYLQSIAQSILYEAGKINNPDLAYKYSSVIGCCRYKRKDIDSSYVNVSKIKNKAYYSNLQNCSSVWLCPVCAAKKAVIRSIEINQALSKAKEQGLQVFFVTYTIPHSKQDSLKDLLDKLTKISIDFRNHAIFRNLVDKVGDIKVLEVKFGANGWHPHYHQYLFFKPTNATNADILSQQFFSVWSSCCLKHNVIANLDDTNYRQHHGFKNHAVVVKEITNQSIVEGDREYLLKAHLFDVELTKSNLKISASSKGSRTPFELLILNTFESRKLFLEYAMAVSNIGDSSSKRQLVWSRGLKKYFNIVDVEKDNDYVNDNDNEIIGIHDEAFKAVKEEGARAKVLNIVECVSIFNEPIKPIEPLEPIKPQEQESIEQEQEPIVLGHYNSVIESLSNEQDEESDKDYLLNAYDLYSKNYKTSSVLVLFVWLLMLIKKHNSSYEVTSMKDVLIVEPQLLIEPLAEPLQEAKETINLESLASYYHNKDVDVKPKKPKEPKKPTKYDILFSEVLNNLIESKNLNKCYFIDLHVRRLLELNKSKLDKVVNILDLSSNDLNTYETLLLKLRGVNADIFKLKVRYYSEIKAWQQVKLVALSTVEEHDLIDGVVLNIDHWSKLLGADDYSLYLALIESKKALRLEIQGFLLSL